MKLRTLTLAFVLAVAGLLAMAHEGVTITFKDGTSATISLSQITALAFSETTLTVEGTDLHYQLSDIDHIAFGNEGDQSQETTQWTIQWDGQNATVSGQHSGVTVTNANGIVTIDNTNTSDEFTYTLQGTGTGAFVLKGDYKATIVLNGLQLTGTGYGEALDIKVGKRVALTLQEGTTNTLADATEDLGQKAALYCKGHLEVGGAGALSLTGNIKHALSTKEYLQLKKTTGSITVVSAANDGFHAGQYYQQNGGSVTISKVGGDGIQAEATGDETKEQDGQMIIKDGVLNITTTATDVAALKSDSLMTLSGGTYTLTTSGAGNKAIKSKQELNITGGEYTIQQSGKACIENGDLGYVTALKGTDVTVSGGKFTITTSGAGARGISAGNLWVSDEADIKITNTGAAGTASDAVEVTSEPDPEPEVEQKSYKVYVNVPTSTSGGGRPGQQTNSVWSSVYLYKSDGTQVATLSLQVTVNGTTFYCYDFGKADTGTYYFGAPNYSSGGFGGGTSYTIKSGTFSGPTSGKDYFYQVSSSYSTSGTTRTYSISNVTSQYEGGTIGGVATSDAFTAKGLKVDSDAHLLGGTINISMSGAGGKGIKVEGNYIQGTEDGNGPTLTIATTGSKYGSTGGSTGGFGGRPGEDSSGSSAKGIKVQGTVVIYGGQTEVSTATDGAEGLESKVKAEGSIRILGGKHYFKCYDDCINSAGGISFDGGVTVCYSTGNDAVDSNYGKAGALEIGNGALLSYTTKGGAEMGFDCDGYNYVRITGNGICITAGGNQGGSSSSSFASAVQGYYIGGSVSYSAGRYYTLADASGNNLVTYSFEGNVSSSSSVFTATGMKSGSSYNVKYSTTAPTDATTAWHGLYLGSTAVGTTNTTSFTAR
ncbi:MAG: carbohydrate-binding domain-containing protein [Bacteroidaceae bacterium]|nr:carbohydrate-binding domain-containing protein [Bacteroidaceae bacterium]